MAPQLGATFVPGGFDDYYMPAVVAPAPQRVNPQVPQNMQDDLQRMELEATEVEPQKHNDKQTRYERAVLVSADTSQDRHAKHTSSELDPSQSKPHMMAYQRDERLSEGMNNMSLDSPSFSPFPKVKGDNVPPSDDAKEEILWHAHQHVLHSQAVAMQITWARDVLIWAEIAMDAAARETLGKQRSSTPRIEHELRLDAINIINHLASQEHPDALYIKSKWLEFGKFGNRVDKREAYSGYRKAAELGNTRSEYRMGMLFEQSNDISRAKEHYYRGMNLKDSAALYRMGMMSLLGQHGETKDYPGGLERIRIAADSSDEDAPQGAYVYGMLIGRDLPDITIPDGLLPHNLETARMYVEKAAYQGFAKAQLKMGQAFELCQLGCDFNPSYSLHYYGLAAKQGVPEAALGVSRWFLFGYEGVFKKNEELAFRYAQEAAAAKLPTGEFAMGYYYEIGIHVNKSLEEARKWYQMASGHGNKDAYSRLESLNQDQTLSKKDHETTTLTRIKSQHGSQRGKRPERLKQAYQMPTLNETTPQPLAGSDPSNYSNAKQAYSSTKISPLPSPNLPPSLPPSISGIPDVSRPSTTGPERQPAFNIRLDSGASQVIRPHSVAPYPEDDGPNPLAVHRSRSTAPYPEDEPIGNLSSYHLDIRTAHGPQSDRPMSAFGIKSHVSGPRPLPSSQSVGNFHQQQHPQATLLGRVTSAGLETNPPNPGGLRPTSSGLSYNHATNHNETSQTRPASAAPGSNSQPTSNRLQKQPHRIYQASVQSSLPPKTVDSGHELSSRASTRPTSEIPSNQEKRLHSTANQERFTRGQDLAAATRSDRLGSFPSQDPRQSRVPMGYGTAQNNASRPAGGRQSTTPLGGTQMQRMDHNGSPAPPKPSKGPATFEDMGIPQGKQEGDCVVM